VHHILGVEIQLTLFLLAPAGFIPVAAPCPVVLMVDKGLFPSLLVVDQ